MKRRRPSAARMGSPRCSHRCSCCGQRCRRCDTHIGVHLYHDESHSGEPGLVELSTLARVGSVCWTATVRIGDEKAFINRDGKRFGEGTWCPMGNSVKLCVGGVPAYVLQSLGAGLQRQMRHVDGTLVDI